MVISPNEQEASYINQEACHFWKELLIIYVLSHFRLGLALAATALLAVVLQCRAPNKSSYERTGTS